MEQLLEENFDKMFSHTPSDIWWLVLCFTLITARHTTKSVLVYSSRGAGGGETDEARRRLGGAP